MAPATLEHGLIAASEAEHALYRRLDDALAAASTHVKLVNSTGEELELPETLYRVLREAVQHLAQDDAVTVVAVQQELTSQQAADLLNVSRPYLIQLLDRDEIPYFRVGTHRRIRLDDLMAYKDVRDAQRRANLRQLTKQSQRLGLYGERASERSA